MLCLPSSLTELLLLFAPCFSRPTYRTFCAMVVGQISQTSLRTVTGMLVGARLSGVWHHARAHRFFSSARWSADELGLRLAGLIVERLCEPGAPVLVAVDDTLLHRLGRKIHACFWHHDATANSDKAAVAWGNNWVVVGICVRPPFLERTVCLPVLFWLWQPRRPEYAKHDKLDPERPAKPVLARATLHTPKVATANQEDRRRVWCRSQASFRQTDRCIIWRLGFRQQGQGRAADAALTRGGLLAPALRTGRAHS